jgi:beta-lactamase class A
MDKLSLKERLKAEIISFSGKMSLYANDFRGNIIEIDADEKYEAGGCINAFILAEFFRQIKDGTIHPQDRLVYEGSNYVYGSGIIRFLDCGLDMTAINFARLMIIVGDNIAANILIDYLGIDNINNTCQDLGFKNTKLHNKLDFDEYEKLGTTTARDYGKYFEKLYLGEMFDEKLSNEIIGIYKKQSTNPMITTDFPQYYLNSEDTGDDELISVASKSGTMDYCRNDGGIIFTPYGGYLLTMFTKKFRDPLYYNEHESYRFGSKSSRLLFDQYMALRGRF